MRTFIRPATAVLAALLFVGLGTGSKLSKLEPYERDHLAALEVWFADPKKETKEFLKLKTPAERDQWLKDRGYWDRYYKYDEYDRKTIQSRDPKVGWKQDWVYMALGAPYRKVKSTKRTAADSIILVYRMEVAKDGAHMVWEPKSKETYKAVRRYQTEIAVDDHVVTNIVVKDQWD